LEIAELDTSISFNQNFAEAYNNRGLVKYKLSQNQKAIDDFNIAIKCDSLNPVYYLNKGLALFALNEKENGCKMLNLANKFNKVYISNEVQSQIEKYIAKNCK